VSKDFVSLPDMKKLESLEKILLVVEKMPDPIKKYLTLHKTIHLEQNMEERAKMNQLLAKIQAIGTLLKHKGAV
jgi:hypothetical protein